MNIKITKRVIENENQDLTSLDDNNRTIEYYNSLKDKLVFNFQKEILNKIESMKILKEIKDNQYYKLDGYNNFEEFTRHYKIAKTQAYEYLKIANAMEEGLIEEQDIIKNGIHNIILSLRDKEGTHIKKSKQNPIKPLRFQLKSQDSYNFYKKNAKFTSFLMDELFSNQKDLLDKLFNKFKELKGS
ncbi:chromosome replication/partitioning protein [Borrelia miyamotoi]|uniref:Chromosome replication/partitioning protein n=1 Tax=Borrelia miyamotoi TaxID=47466 RepID=A0AAQ2WWW0_9SPIR|nr:chromosome replication/partitioning protein [Borrelia miyamotoi]QTL84321.1 chromosome replication/partitioning protein [Borrelia miyamotoi]WAZ85992.1 chromosome replication/partitioning protein [Borrelia miyamotoi]WAZ91774.1 chromosome replication/partitioning protein [Borrelia miyamotoi]WAZ93066.1 chromosome replication/partitioning protein [Borrelia miyamotoi]WAZ94359.1 chromosome replication/partitioning protein [Borrelia miyamotoi]